MLFYGNALPGKVREGCALFCSELYQKLAYTSENSHFLQHAFSHRISNATLFVALESLIQCPYARLCICAAVSSVLVRDAGVYLIMSPGRAVKCIILIYCSSILSITDRASYIFWKL